MKVVYVDIWYLNSLQIFIILLITITTSVERLQNKCQIKSENLVKILSPAFAEITGHICQFLTIYFPVNTF